MPEYIRLNLFPATVTVGETVYTPARCVVTDDSVLVFVDAAGGPQLVYEKRLDDFSGSRKVGYNAVCDTDEITITKTSGCGCGSKLRSMRVFPGVPTQ